MDRHFAPFFACLVLVLGLTIGQAWGKPVKLNPPLPQDQIVGYNLYPEWDLLPCSPDGRWVVFNSVDNQFAATRTYFALTSGWYSTPLYPEGYIPLTLDPGVFSPNGRWFVSPLQDPDGNCGLYSKFFPSVSGNPVRISQIMECPSALTNFTVSPDSSRVIYTAVLINEQSTNLYSVPTGGGTPIQLNQSLDAGQTIKEFKVSRLGNQVVFTVGTNDGGVGNPVSVHSTPITGGTITHLADNALVSDVYPLLITPDGQQVIYRTQDGIVGQAITGGAKILLVPSDSLGLASDRLAVNSVALSPVPQDPQWPRMRLSPNGYWIVYLSDDDDLLEIYSIPIAGGNPIRLNLPGTISGNPVEDYFQISPDSRMVVFVDYAPGDTSGTRSLMTVPISGGTPTVFGPNAGYFEITNDSSRVVGFFMGIPSPYLGSVRITGGTPVVLSSQGSAQRQFNLTPNSRWVVFKSIESAFPARESIYRAPVQGGSLEWLSSNMGPNDWIEGTFVVTTDSRRVLYCKSEIGKFDTELYSNQIAPWLPFLFLLVCP
jgi:Tol biopolymer transport system component